MRRTNSIGNSRRDLRERRDAKKSGSSPMPVFIGAVVVIMIVIIVLKGRSARGSCTWDHAYRKATCKNKELKMLPTDIPETVTAINMGSKLDKAENLFSVLDARNFSKYPLLAELGLVKCGIEEIRPGTFRKLSSLRRIDLRYNRLQYLSEATFKGLDTLESLYLSNNPLTSLKDNVFRGLRIEHLVLGNNPALTDISPRAFSGSAVRAAVFNRCGVATLHEDTFDPLEDSLQELYITHNMQPLKLPEGILDGLRLQKLTLTKTGLSETKFLKGLIAERLILDDNDFVEFTGANYRGLKETKKLSLARCGLRKISIDNLSSFSGLLELDLEENDLTLLDARVFKGMPLLERLDLDDNDLEEFVGDFATSFQELKSLSLSGNEFTTLPKSMQNLFSRLTNLTLEGNPFHCNCELHWLARWLEKSTHRHILKDLDAVACATPEELNFTHVSDYGFQCRRPAVFNATFDSDGITLLCTAEGDPPPMVTWVSPGGKEKSTVPPRWQREVFKTQSSLTISRDGNYTCVATNNVGEDSITVNTRKMPSSGLKFHVESQTIDIIGTQPGFVFTSLLVLLLGYVIRTESLIQIERNRTTKKNIDPSMTPNGGLPGGKSLY